MTNPGYNHIVENQYSLTNPSPGGPVPGGSGGPLSAAMFQMNAAGIAEGRVYWDDVQNFFEVTPIAQNNIPNAVAPSGVPIHSTSSEPSGNIANNGSGIAGLATYRPDAIPDFAGYADYVGTNDNLDGYHEPFNAVPGGVYYTDKVITDTSIFNFYKKLLDGPNKHEWKHWNSYDLDDRPDVLRRPHRHRVRVRPAELHRGCGTLAGGHQLRHQHRCQRDLSRWHAEPERRAPERGPGGLGW